jgi:hypothetical protein
MNKATWNKDKTVLTYKTDDGDWLKEIYNDDLNLLKRTTSYGEWMECEYVKKGKAKGRIAIIRKNDGTYKTFNYDEAGKLIQKKARDK